MHIGLKLLLYYYKIHCCFLKDYQNNKEIRLGQWLRRHALIVFYTLHNIYGSVLQVQANVNNDLGIFGRAFLNFKCLICLIIQVFKMKTKTIYKFLIHKLFLNDKLCFQLSNFLHFLLWSLHFKLNLTRLLTFFRLNIYIFLFIFNL